MINVTKLVNDKGDFVYVNSDETDIQYVHFTGLGYFPEGSRKVEVKVPQTGEPKPNDPNTAVLDLDNQALMALPKEKLIELAKSKKVTVSASDSKAEIVKQLLAKA